MRRILLFLFLLVIFAFYIVSSFADSGGGWAGIKIRNASDIDQTDIPADGEAITWNDTTKLFEYSSGSGAPTNADYLVGTANGSLSNEIVVGTSPGGSLGGTWASPTVDNDSHTHTGATLSSIDISADTNLTAGDALTLTDDDIDFDGGSAPAGELGGTWASPTVNSVHSGSAHHSAVTVTDTTTVNLTLTGQDIQADSLLTAGDHLTLTAADFDVDDDFLLNTGDVGTGVYDFGGVTSFEIVNGASPTVDALGEIAFDTTDNTLIAYDGSAAQVYGFPVKSQYFSFANDGDWDSETIPLPGIAKDMAVTIKEVDVTVIGGSWLNFNLEERAWGAYNSTGTNITSAPIAATIDGLRVTNFSNSSIAADAGLFLTTGASAATGTTANFITGTIYYELSVE